MKNRIFATLFAVVALTTLLLGQAFAPSQIGVVHAQTTPISFDNMTQLSPDGQKVVYVTAQNLGMAGTKIWIANADGTQNTILVAGDSVGNSYWITNPIWSPDGQQIAYIKAVKETSPAGFVTYRYEIWAIGMNGANNHLLTNTLFSPLVGYGGQTDLVWNSSNEIEFAANTTFPSKLYAVNATTLAIREIQDQSGALGDLPPQASIADVTAYYQGGWGNQIINPGNCNYTLSESGSAITAAAMVLDTLLHDGTNPSSVNSLMSANNGFTGCLLGWTTLVNVYPGIKVDDSSINRSDVLEKMRRQVAGGVPVILWYYEVFPNNQNFLVVTGYDQDNNITAIDPSSGDSITRNFFDASYPIAGMILIKKDKDFSKIAPVSDVENTIDPSSITLEWNTMLPTPDSYRYCMYKKGEVGKCANNSGEWTNAGTTNGVPNTHVTLSRDPNTTYYWQVQAKTGSAKVDANGGDWWTFRTANPPTITISGNAGGVPYATITYTGGNPIQADATGFYNITVPNGWTGTITPSKTGVIFYIDGISAEQSRTYTDPQTTNLTNQNYVARVWIDGLITPNTFTNATPRPIGQINYMPATSNDFDGFTTTSSASGYQYYKLKVPYGWRGTIKPVYAGFTFSPAQVDYLSPAGVTASTTNPNFAAVVYFTTLKSIAADDGWILESSTTQNTANSDGFINDTGLLMALGNQLTTGTNPQRQQRVILSFDTGSLPDNATIQSAVLQIKQYQTVPADPFVAFGPLHVDVRKGIFGTLSTMQLMDFDAGASATSVANFNSTPANGWYSATLPATGPGLSNINLVGNTQFRLRFDTHLVLTIASMNFYSGNYSNVAFRPELTIMYTLP